MDKALVRKYVLDFNERALPELVAREVRLRDSSKIQSVIGARRVGKTYLLFNKIKDLLATGVKKDQIIYLNFENPYLHEISYKEYKDILEVYWSLFPAAINQKTYLFIDEPQTITNWELAVREIYDEHKFQIFITGSSSKLLSKEIATCLRGRAITINLFPLSFKEFLLFKKKRFDIKKLSTVSKAQLLNSLNEFLSYGSYPEIVLENNELEKLKIIKDYLDMTIYKDIIERYSIKNMTAMKSLINYMISASTKEVSLNKFYLNLRAQGLKISKNTIYEYFKILEDSLFIHQIKKFDYSIKNQDLSTPKVFLNDTCFLNLFSIEDYGKRMENVVLLELLRQKNNNPLMKINYWKSKDGLEVDFIINHGTKPHLAIQVCYSLSDFKTKEREIKALHACLNYFSIKQGIIITYDDEAHEKIQNKSIQIIPLWKWLLI